MKKVIYLDNNATTKLDPRVLEAMMPFLTESYANAASTHPFGVEAHGAVKNARAQVADLIGCETNEIIFTASATEAINLAIKGIAETYQAVGKLPVNVNELGIDLMSFSGHKFCGPKGIGALYVRSKRPNKVKLNPLIHGGGHEKGLRSGTLNVPGIVGLGKAAEIAKREMETDAKRIGELRDYLETELLKIENTSLNGHPTKRLYNMSNICFKGADADATMVGLKGIMISNGSACSSTKIEPSHVLKALGRNDEDAYSSISPTFAIRGIYEPLSQ